MIVWRYICKCCIHPQIRMVLSPPRYTRPRGFWVHLDPPLRHPGQRALLWPIHVFRLRLLLLSCSAQSLCRCGGDERTFGRLDDKQEDLSETGNRKCCYCEAAGACRVQLWRLRHFWVWGRKFWATELPVVQGGRQAYWGGQASAQVEPPYPRKHWQLQLPGVHRGDILYPHFIYFACEGDGWKKLRRAFKREYVLPHLLRLGRGGSGTGCWGSNGRQEPTRVAKVEIMKILGKLGRIEFHQTTCVDFCSQVCATTDGDWRENQPKIRSQLWTTSCLRVDEKRCAWRCHCFSSRDLSQVKSRRMVYLIEKSKDCTQVWRCSCVRRPWACGRSCGGWRRSDLLAICLQSLLPVHWRDSLFWYCQAESCQSHYKWV